MRAIILSTLLIISINAQNVWYVDRDAPGPTHNGTSWNNAFTKISNVPWGSLSGGDTVYVSGGTDSTTYNSTSISVNAPGKVYNSEVVVTRAWHSGHNGIPYIVNSNNASRTFNVQRVSNIKFYGFTITVKIPSQGNEDFLFVFEYDSLITLDNCHLIGDGTISALVGGGYQAGRITVTNCIVENLPNDYENDQDPFQVYGTTGGHTFTHNTIIARSTSTGGNSGHRDMMQLGVMGDPRKLTTTIAYNTFIYDAPNAAAVNTGMLYFSTSDNNRFLIHNNLVIFNIKNFSSIIFPASEPPLVNNSFYVYNNTFLIKGGGSPVYMNTFVGVDTLVMKNNVFVADSSITYQIVIASATYSGMYKDIDYNYYYQKNGTANWFAGGNSRTFSNWQSINGFDVNGYYGEVAFAEKWGTDIEDYITSQGKDAGVDLSSIIPAIDILGNPRNDGNWDMGAIEFVGGSTNDVKVFCKVYLQGPFNSNSMSTTLKQSGLLPTSQPYNTPPWNYNGNETQNLGSNSTLVDWVPVELRNASNPTQLITRRAVILKNDGLLLEPNGTEGILFTNVDPGSYYIAIYHRNHLAIMSSSPVQLSSNSQLYDFTTAMNKAFGQDPMIELGAGKYGMYASDGSGNGVIDSLDYNAIYLEQRGTLGYKEGDFNLDSGVSVYDVNQFYNINEGKESQVP